ncbi:hypothetical protein V6N00_13235 [Tersicoccus sp. MR15.9]|uniref:hypothetical protein n=1 Tax=Tersicoccus mangrovi TaxID=3121635 RepID=UPI002FE6405B
MSTTTVRARVQRGVPEGGEFAATSHAEPAISLITTAPATVPATIEEARVAGYQARYPHRDLEQANAVADRLRAAADRDWYVVDEVERIADDGDFPAREVWDIRDNLTDLPSGVRDRGPSFRRGPAAADVLALTASGATFRNCYDDRTDGTLTVNTDGVGAIRVKADEDGRLLIGRTEEDGTEVFVGGGSELTDAQLWAQEITGRVDAQAMSTASAHTPQTGQLDGHFDDETGEARFTWRDGTHTVTDTESTFEPSGRTVDFHIDAKGEAHFEYDQSAEGHERTADALVAMYSGTKTAAEAHHNLTSLARETRDRMIWHPDVAGLRFAHREGPIRDGIEGIRYRDRIESQLPDGVKLGTTRGEAVLWAETADWAARVQIAPDGTTRYFVNGQQTIGLDPTKRKQMTLDRALAEQREKLTVLATAAYRGVA